VAKAWWTWGARIGGPEPAARPSVLVVGGSSIWLGSSLFVGGTVLEAADRKRKQQNEDARRKQKQQDLLREREDARRLGGETGITRPRPGTSTALLGRHPGDVGRRKPRRGTDDRHRDKILHHAA